MSERPTFYGKYQGVVVNVIDPERRGRILAQVPAVYKDGVSGWAEPCLPLVGIGTGFLALPQLGSKVWIEFEQGDPERPIWCGGFWAPGTAPMAIAPLQTVLKTTGGNVILIDDTPGIGGITLQTIAGDTFQISPATGILLQTFTGEKIEATPVGITIQSASGCKIMVNAAGVMLSTPTGASVDLLGNMVLVNKGALEVI